MTNAWFMDDEPSESFPIYTRGNVGEVFPDPVSPLTADHTWHGAGNHGLLGFMTRFTIDADELDPGQKTMFEIFGGYMFLNLSVARLMGARSSGMTPELVDLGFFGTGASLPPYVARPKDGDPAITQRVDGMMFDWMTATKAPEVAAQAAEVADIVANRPNLSTATDADLVARTREMPPVFSRLFATHSEASAAASVVMGALTVAALGVGKPGLDLRIAGGLGGVASAEPSDVLWDLGRLVAASPELTEAFDEGLDGLIDRLQDLGPAAADFLTGFADFTTTYGSRGPNEWELRSRTWETHPELPLALVDRMRFSPDSDDPSTTRAAAHQRSGEALELLQSMVADNEEAAGTLAIAAPAARAWIPAREQCKATIVRIIHEVRLAARELGRRMAADGRLTDADHVFMLRDAEMEAALNGDMAETAATRQADYLALFEVQPPYWFAGEVPKFGLRSEAPVVEGPSKTILQGMGGSAGTVEGLARVVLDPSDPLTLEPGEILVAPITDPSWTPLFVPAAGVVVDVGAVMSHAVIVSRELGIPCVVSAAGATTRILDGARIRVNGDTGTVTILQD
jgi:pyruvate,water dikinase